jgi:hypothetical protein
MGLQQPGRNSQAQRGNEAAMEHTEDAHTCLGVQVSMRRELHVCRLNLEVEMQGWQGGSSGIVPA